MTLTNGQAEQNKGKILEIPESRTLESCMVWPHSAWPSGWLTELPLCLTLNKMRTNRPTRSPFLFLIQDVNKVPHPSLYFWIDSKLTASDHVSMSKRGIFWCIQKFHYLPVSQGFGGLRFKIFRPYFRSSLKFVISTRHWGWASTQILSF